MPQLINRAETGAGNGAIIPLLLLDGPDEGDSYLYRLSYDEDGSCPNFHNPTCDGRYAQGQNMWTWGENTGSPYSLAEFVKGAVRAYPNANRVILSLVGHGGGWAPNLLAGQPSDHGEQPGPGGLLWDDHPGSSLSTAELGQALRWAHQATGQKVNLLYLDACLMEMSEVAYEVSDSVDYLLASQSWSWTVFPYDAHLNAIAAGQSPAQIGAAWLDNEAALLRADGYPFTLSLADLSQTSALQSALDALALALIAALPANKAAIQAAYDGSDCFDSSQDGVIDHSDNYCDLSSFAAQLEAQFSQNITISAAAQAVQTAVANSILDEDHQDGVPWPYPEQTWTWGDLGGLSLYLPLRQDDWKRRYYTAEHLQSARDGQWDEFLSAFWDNVEPPQDPGCPPGGCELPPPGDTAAISAHARAGQDQILLRWTLQNAVPNLYGYTVYRQEDGGAFTLISSTLRSDYEDADPALTEDTEYCYQVKALDDSDAVVGESNVTCVRYGELSLWIPNQAAAPGATNTLVPVNLVNGDGLCIGAMNITLHYDEAVVQANGSVSPTIYTAGYQFEANTGTPGQVKISAIVDQCTPLYGPGSLFQIGFDAIGSEGQISPLDFITGLTGTVIYDDDDLFNPLSLALNNGSLIVQSAYIRGDVNGEGAVNAADALLALRIAAGKFTPTPRQRAACDVNGDEDCNAGDASLILCYAAYQDWGVCGLGGGGAMGQMMRQTAVQSYPVQLGFGQVSGSGQSVSVPVLIKDGPELAGGDFSFSYDPAVMTPTGVSLASLTGGYKLASHTPQAGLLRVSLANNAPLTADGEIFILSFILSDGVSAQDLPLTFNHPRLNDAAGRDFEASGLQKELVIVDTQNRIFLPLVIKSQ